MSRYVRLFIGAVMIGAACRLLQPEQPESAIATVLLVGVLVLLTETHDG